MFLFGYGRIHTDDVELGLEENDQTKLICKICTEGECREVFHEFFDTANVYDRKGYEPIQIRIGR